MNTTNKKPWYQSKTIWTFGVLFIASLLDHFGIVSIPLSEDATWLGTFFSLLAIIYRAITGKELTLTKTSVLPVLLFPILFIGFNADNNHAMNKHEIAVLQDAGFNINLIDEANVQFKVFEDSQLRIVLLEFNSVVSEAKELKQFYRWNNEQYENKLMVKLKHEAIKYKRNNNFTDYNIRVQQCRFNC